MADIVVTSTGKHLYRVDDGAAAALLEAFPEAFARVKPPQAPAPAGPRIFVGPSMRGNPGIHCNWPSGQTYSIFDPRATKAGAEKEFCVSIPDEIWEQFQQALKPVNVGLSEADRAADEVRRMKEKQITAGIIGGPIPG
jgi:hypothetical protein